MRVLLQRVSISRVIVREQVCGKIDAGLMLLVGIAPEDDQAMVKRMANKVAHLRIFSDELGKFNLSLLDVGGGALVVSQFTLYADARRGRRPAFTAAARPEQAAELVDHFKDCLKAEGVTRVESGEFGASMSVSLVNEGPVTIWLDSVELFA